MGGQDARLVALKAAVTARSIDLGIDPNEIVYLDESAFAGRYDRKKPAFGIYFGNAEQNSAGTARPTGTRLYRYCADRDVKKRWSHPKIPNELQHINVVEVGMNGDNIPRLASLIFETFRLLRKERGIFISYRRKGSQPLANRL